MLAENRCSTPGGGRLFGAPKLVCVKQWLLENAPLLLQTQLEPGEDREAEEQRRPPTKHQRVDDAQPGLSSVLDACLNQFFASADKR